MVERLSSPHSESPEYVAICYALGEDESRRQFVAVIQKVPDADGTNRLQVLKSGLEVVYECLLVNSRITSWHLTRDRFVYQDDENSDQITYVKFYDGQVSAVK